eukprot:1148237-Pelagomonas_calceolata.AAC.3
MRSHETQICTNSVADGRNKCKAFDTANPGLKIKKSVDIGGIIFPRILCKEVMKQMLVSIATKTTSKAQGNACVYLRCCNGQAVGEGQEEHFPLYRLELQGVFQVQRAAVPMERDRVQKLRMTLRSALNEGVQMYTVTVA